MLQKWKTILTNWINCYFNECSTGEQNVSLESLITIISHLRENLNLDESKSSVLEAHTVEEFIIEKYPEFKFDNNSTEPASEDDLYTVASLLLLFVCVNSKDVDIKNAMCNKLSIEDQETIMKFSKYLMECSPISYSDVQNSITEACGQDIACVDTTARQATVAETPPALRSLHGEVRRLQAALDAERFDRNYLQDELARTNLKLEKLLKEKEQYKLDIVNLKSKISLCCGQEAESKTDNGGEGTSKLIRQLQQMEERLVDTQGQLDDILYERDTYKAKMDELKQERDKWLAHSQEEASRVTQLSEELEAERRGGEALRELVAELRQHHRLNRLDASQCELDDPDGSLHLAQNTSICSEVCANVVEVQLGEERAKIEVLKQHIQSLQDKIAELEDVKKERDSLQLIVDDNAKAIKTLEDEIVTQKQNQEKLIADFENERLVLKNMVTVTEAVMEDQKVSLNKQITDYLNANEVLQEENKNINMLLKVEREQFDSIMQQKDSLVESTFKELSDLKDDKDKMLAEKGAVEKEIEIMKETVLLKDFQIETLQSQNKELEDILQKCKNDISLIEATNNELIEKKDALQAKLIEKIEALSKDIDEQNELCNGLRNEIREKSAENTHLQNDISNLNEKLIDLNDQINTLLKENNELRAQKQEIEEKIKIIETSASKEIEIMKETVLFKGSEIETLESQNRELENILQKCKNDIALIEDINSKLTFEKDALQAKLIEKVEKLSKDIEEQNEVCNRLQDEIKEKIAENTDLQNDITSLNENVRDLNDQINMLDKEKRELEALKEEMAEKITKLERNASKDTDKINKLKRANTHLINNLKGISTELNCVKKERDKLQLKVDDNAKAIKILEEKIKTQKQNHEKLITDFENERLVLKNMVTVTEAVMEDQKVGFNKLVTEYSQANEALQEENNNLNMLLDVERKQAALNMQQKDSVLDSIFKEISDLKDDKNRILAEKEVSEKEIEILKETELFKDSQIETLESQNRELEAILQKCQNDIAVIEDTNNELKLKKDALQAKLMDKIEKLTKFTEEQNEVCNRLQDEITEKTRENADLQNDISYLNEKLRELNDLINMLLKEKNGFETQKQDMVEKITKLETSASKEIEILKETVLFKDSEIEILKSQNRELKDIVQKCKSDIAAIEDTNNELKLKRDALQAEVRENVEKLLKDNTEHNEMCNRLQDVIKEKNSEMADMQNEISNLNDKLGDLNDQIIILVKEKNEIEAQKQEMAEKIIKIETSSLNEIKIMQETVFCKDSQIESLNLQNRELEAILLKCKNDMALIEDTNGELKLKKDALQAELIENVEKLSKDNAEHNEVCNKLQDVIKEKTAENTGLQDYINNLNKKLQDLNDQIIMLVNEKIEFEAQKQDMAEKIAKVETSSLKEIEIMRETVLLKKSQIETLESQNRELEAILQKCKNDIALIEDNNNELKLKKDALQATLIEKIENLSKNIEEQNEVHNKLQDEMNKKSAENKDLQNYISNLNEKLKHLNDQINVFVKEKSEFEAQKQEMTIKITELEATASKDVNEINTLKKDNSHLIKIVDDNKTVINNLEQLVKHELQQNQKLRDDTSNDKINLTNKCFLLQESQTKAEKQLEDRQKEIAELQVEVRDLKLKLDCYEKEIDEKNEVISNMAQEKDVVIGTMSKVLMDKQAEREQFKKELEKKQIEVEMLRQNLEAVTREVETGKKENEELVKAAGQKETSLKTLEQEIKTHKQNEEKLIKDFENERLVLKNMVTVTEAVMEDQKVALNKVVTEYMKANEALQEENKHLNMILEVERKKTDLSIQQKDSLFESVFKEMSDLKDDKDKILADKDMSEKEIEKMKETVLLKDSQIETLQSQNKELEAILQKCKNDIALIEETNNEFKLKKDALQAKLVAKVEKLSKDIEEQIELCNRLREEIKDKSAENAGLQNEISNLNEKLRDMNDEINMLVKEKSEFETQKQEMSEIITKLETSASKDIDEINKLKKENTHLIKVVDENKIVINNLEQLIKHELQQNQQLRDDTSNDKINLTNKCFLLQEYQTKAEKLLEDRQKEIDALQENIKDFKLKLDTYEQEIDKKNEIIANIAQEKDVVIGTMSKELMDEQAERERCKKELEKKQFEVEMLRQKLEVISRDGEARRRENEALVKPGQTETFPMVSYEKPSSKLSSSGERDAHHNQVDNTSDYTHSSMESLKTISDLEKIIHDKNRTITTLHTDITYMKSLMAESENKLLDVTKELDIAKENCYQLSTQLKKIVHQKNDEISELKKQVSKMSVTENRATQIIKVSAKYQAIILKRIAEIKNNTVLKELTNFGNNTSPENELRRSLNAGTITMEDLENFLETTESHIRKCSDKQRALQKERDRLNEVNRINESEIINLKKFLTELSVSYKTFVNIKELYAQKLSRVVSIQRTVRREILSLDGQVTDATMCKLERGYAAVMQDLSECCMNMERWVERCLERTLSPEKIKQAFSSDTERASLAPTTFQNTSLEVQLEEMENSFQKLLEEVVREQKGEGAREAQALTVMEVRAEYEDKLNRMKAKMKQLYHEQIAVFQEKQKQEIVSLEKELQAARHKLTESSKAYEEHIRGLTMELWDVGQKFLVKKDEAEWLRRKQHSGSLMSLQHVHSSGLVPPQVQPPPRPSDTHSLRSLPVTNTATNTNTKTKREGRGLHMSDEEGEVFDNRWLKELSSTPRRPRSPRDSGLRLSELRWRNSLCPPHLKSSYPAETQFAPVIDEDDIKCAGAGGPARAQRKEVGITAYKKPGPPTPSKQAGRLSATDSELRESLRVEADPQPSRKTSTPSRIRALFKRNDTTEGTPRTKRLSIFRKK